jgi:hypothetical protein
MKVTVFLLLVMLLNHPLYSQFSLNGEIRPRAEFRQGYRRMPQPEDTPAGLVSQRTRLTFGFGTDRLTTNISLQDVRIWGQERTLTHEPSLDLHEAWVQLDVNEKLSLRAGRQVLQYDNQRFLAVNDWSQVAQKHDGLIMRYLNNSNELHIGAAFNQSAERLTGTQYYLSNYKTLNYLWYKTALTPALDVSVLVIADGYEHPENPRLLYMRGTWSTYFQYQPGAFSVSANPGYQHGKTPSGQDIAAWYFSVEATTPTLSFMNATLGVELLSGNDYKNPGSAYQAFNPSYGAGHTVHGFMDYFTDIPSHTRGAGLVNPYLKNRFVVNENLVFDADLHLFYLQNNYVHEADVIKKYLGTEMDITLSYSFNPLTQISVGYSMMFGTESMEIISGGNKNEFAHWGFIMLRVTPVFL